MKWSLRHLMWSLGVTLTLMASPFAAALDTGYADYSSVLQKHVRWTADGHGSVVDYVLLERDHDGLTAVLRSFSAVTPNEFSGWGRAQQKAFLINAYNAFTLELVLTRYPNLQSIRDLGSLLRSPWKKSFFELLGDRRTLDWIEHQRLRPDYHDERVHFAVNCASVGCPALRPEAYVAERLDEQLEDQQRRFLSDRTRNRFNEVDGILSVSAIFEWFGDDFTKGDGGVKDWLAARAQWLADRDVDRARIRRGEFRIEHLSYDWSLNKLDGER